MSRLWKTGNKRGKRSALEEMHCADLRGDGSPKWLVHGRARNAASAKTYTLRRATSGSKRPCGIAAKGPVKQAGDDDAFDPIQTLA